jgi:hypothetical protein
MSYMVTDLVWTQERLGPPPHQGTSFIYMTNRGKIGVGVLVWELWLQSPTVVIGLNPARPSLGVSVVQAESHTTTVGI